MIKTVARNIVGSLFHKKNEKPSLDSLNKKEHLLEVADRVLATSADNAIDTWQQFLFQVANHIKNDDLNGFLQWPEIKAAMFASNQRFVKSEYSVLRTSDNWSPRWHSATRECRLGHPIPFVKDLGSSGNLIHHAYLLSIIEESLNVKVHELNSLFEFGGGYGDMAKLFQNLGFEGDYVIYDFELFSALQSWYLSNLGFKVETLKESKQLNSDKIHCVSGDEPIPIIDLIAGDEKSMFLATWSLSETPIEYRAIFESVLSSFEYIVIAYQHEIEGLDNVAYFGDLQSNLDSHEWSHRVLEFQPGSSLLIGCRKASEDDFDVNR